MASFKSKMLTFQISWKNNHLPHIILQGWQNGHQYEHILPRINEEENFYPPIRSLLFNKPNGYLSTSHVKPHTGIHNLLSSWVCCANIYWPFNNTEGKILLSEYFKAQTNLDIETIQSVELEYEDDDLDLKPSKLLGEENKGIRGSGQTSPDLAIVFKTKDGEDGILLIECKFTEHSFYICSGFKKKNSSGKEPNQNNTRCLDTKGIVASHFTDCHLTKWDRKYWDLVGNDLDTGKFSALSRCPMSTCCYQLFRQQALAKGFQLRYSIVASCVAMDERNTTLLNSGKRTGLKQFPQGWHELFPGLPFFWITHQAWFEFVKANNANGRWDDWIEYVGERYFPNSLSGKDKTIIAKTIWHIGRSCFTKSIAGK